MRLRVGVVWLAVVGSVLRAREVRAQLAELRAALEPGVRLWIGGAQSGTYGDVAVRFASLEDLEHGIEVLRLEAEAR